MGHQPLEELLLQTNNSIYKLVILASKRAVEIAEGMPKLVEGINSDKPVTIALEEIRQGKVGLLRSETKEKEGQKK